jgi:hypothetical protein
MLLFYTHPKAMRKSPPLYWYTLFTAGIPVHILYQLSIHSPLLWCKDCTPYLQGYLIVEPSEVKSHKITQQNPACSLDY